MLYSYTSVPMKGYQADNSGYYITDERDGLAKFVELCNAEKLEIEHIQNVVEDFLCVNK